MQLPPDFMILGAFRYALGRMTYVVGETVDWLLLQWPNLPSGVKSVIARDLNECFERDDRMRLLHSDYKPLGMDMDRREWQRLRDRITGDEDAQAGGDAIDERAADKKDQTA